MDFLKKIAVVTILAGLSISCSKNFDSVLRESKIKNEANIGKSTLDGNFHQIDGVLKNLSSLNDKPLLLFFVSETCSSCREEAEHLIEEISVSGYPTKINLLSVLIGSLPEDITFWRDSFSPAISWELGADPDLILYKIYFKELRTPSVMYFDPQTQVLKKWQNLMTIEKLKKETGPWN